MVWCLTRYYFYNITTILTHTFPSDLQEPGALSVPLSLGHFWGDSPELEVPQPLPNPLLLWWHPPNPWRSYQPELKEINTSLPSELQLLNHWEMKRKSSQFGKQHFPKENFSTVGQMGRRNLCAGLRWNNSFVVRLLGNSKEKWGGCLLSRRGMWEKKEGENVMKFQRLLEWSKEKGLSGSKELFASRSLIPVCAQISLDLPLHSINLKIQQWGE